MNDTQPILSALPSVNDVADTAAGQTDAARALVLMRAREVISLHRQRLQTSLSDQPVTKEALLEQIVRDVVESVHPGLRRVINATGVILHTGLGRAPLADEAVAALVDAARFSNVQADLEEGARSTREAHVEVLLRHITGCEAAAMVNNNAAATLLVLAAVARGREVIVSRGELVEIGGSYRIPDVMAESGAVLVEVGCTNRTHWHDYERAITERTAAIMKVHTSNYAIQGFTSAVELEELSALTKARGLLLIHDMGSGSLVDLGAFGLTGEPPASRSLERGADLVTFSGDKLVGGPQAGIIIGSQLLIERIRVHPLARAVRVDKLALAAMEATLRLLLDADGAVRRVPTLRMITAPPAEIRRRALRLARILRRAVPGVELRVSRGVSRAGSGAFPVLDLPTTLVEIHPGVQGPNDAARRLRQSAVPVFVRIVRDRLVVDVRTVFPQEEQELVTRLAAVVSPGD